MIYRNFTLRKKLSYFWMDIYQIYKSTMTGDRLGKERA